MNNSIGMIFERCSNVFHPVQHGTIARPHPSCLSDAFCQVITRGIPSLNIPRVFLHGRQQRFVIETCAIPMPPARHALDMRRDHLRWLRHLAPQDCLRVRLNALHVVPMIGGEFPGRSLRLHFSISLKSACCLQSPQALSPFPACSHVKPFLRKNLTSLLFLATRVSSVNFFLDEYPSNLAYHWFIRQATSRALENSMKLRQVQHSLTTGR